METVSLEFISCDLRCSFFSYLTSVVGQSVALSSGENASYQTLNVSAIETHVPKRAEKPRMLEETIDLTF